MASSLVLVVVLVFRVNQIEDEHEDDNDARGSAVECAACFDALAAKTLVMKARIAEGKALLLRIVGMLTKLVERFDAYRAREGEETDD